MHWIPFLVTRQVNIEIFSEIQRYRMCFSQRDGLYEKLADYPSLPGYLFIPIFYQTEKGINSTYRVIRLESNGLLVYVLDCHNKTIKNL
jgi:hypothetical protein